MHCLVDDDHEGSRYKHLGSSMEYDLLVLRARTVCIMKRIACFDTIRHQVLFNAIYSCFIVIWSFQQSYTIQGRWDGGEGEGCESSRWWGAQKQRTVTHPAAYTVLFYSSNIYITTHWYKEGREQGERENTICSLNSYKMEGTTSSQRRKSLTKPTSTHSAASSTTSTLPSAQKILGRRIKLKTASNEEIEGRIYALDRLTNCIALDILLFHATMYTCISLESSFILNSSITVFYWQCSTTRSKTAFISYHQDISC